MISRERFGDSLNIHEILIRENLFYYRIVSESYINLGYVTFTSVSNYSCSNLYAVQVIWCLKKLRDLVEKLNESRIWKLMNFFEWSFCFIRVFLIVSGNLNVMGVINVSHSTRIPVKIIFFFCLFFLPFTKYFIEKAFA